MQEKTEQKDMKRWGLKSQTLGGMPKDRGCSLNTVEIGLRKGFFPWKILYCFTCKRNYFVLQRKTAILPAGESEMWNVSMRLNE